LSSCKFTTCTCVAFGSGTRRARRRDVWHRRPVTNNNQDCTAKLARRLLSSPLMVTSSTSSLLQLVHVHPDQQPDTHQASASGLWTGADREWSSSDAARLVSVERLLCLEREELLRQSAGPSPTERWRSDALTPGAFMHHFGDGLANHH
jgi:hypothetical protein